MPDDVRVVEGRDRPGLSQKSLQRGRVLLDLPGHDL